MTFIVGCPDLIGVRSKYKTKLFSYKYNLIIVLCLLKLDKQLYVVHFHCSTIVDTFALLMLHH